jgi:hypothetical protein
LLASKLPKISPEADDDTRQQITVSERANSFDGVQGTAADVPGGKSICNTN